MREKDRNDNMDNFGVHVTARDPNTFRSAFRLAFNPPGDKARFYRITPIKQDNWMIVCAVPALVLLWHEDGECIPLPYEMDCDAALSFAEHWLKNAAYPEQPDHDGSNARGFQITTGNFCGHVDNSHYSIMAVLPCWALLGK